MIVLKSSENYPWPWSDSGTEAETHLRADLPGDSRPPGPGTVMALRKRQDQGRYWWELRSCAYWADFDSPKTMYPEITWRPEWVVDTPECSATTRPTSCPQTTLGSSPLLNSPISWWYAWRTAIHGKDEALRFIKEFVQDFPTPYADARAIATLPRGDVGRLVEITRTQQATRRQILDWLRVEYEVEKPTLKLQSPFDLDCDALRCGGQEGSREEEAAYRRPRWRTSGRNTPDPSTPPAPLRPKP